MFSLMVPSSRSECADDCCHPDHGHYPPKMTSWWRDTPWPEIREHVRLTLSRAEFEAWLERPDVIERATADTHDEWRSLNESQDGKDG